MNNKNEAGAVRQGRLKLLACGALLALAGFLLYARTLHYPFVYDDDSFVVLNPAIRSLKNVPSFFSDPSTLAADASLARDNYRPLVTLSYALNYAAGGLDPFGYRLFNLLLHLFNACLLLWLAWELFESAYPGRGRLPALICAAAFMAHPVQVESVVWVSQRSNILALFFCLLALHVHLRRKGAGAASLTLFGLALLCKEAAVVLPLFVWLWESYSRKEGRGRRLAALRRAAPYFALTSAFTALRYLVLGRVGQTGYWAGSFYFTMLTMTKGLATYLRLMVLPHPLSLEYLFATSHSLGEPRVLLSCAVIAAPLSLAWALRERRPILSLGIMLFFAGLAPVSNVIPIKAVIAERFLYFSLIGFGVALGDLAAWAAAPSMAWVWPALLTAYAGFTFARSRDWSSHKSLVLATLKTCPQSARMHYGLGRQYAADGDFVSAAREFQTVLAIDPAYDEASRDLGRLALQRGDWQEAVTDYRKTLQVRIDQTDALAGLGTAYLRLGDFAQAARILESALKVSEGRRAAGAQEGRAEIMSNLAAAYAGESDLIGLVRARFPHVAPMLIAGAQARYHAERLETPAGTLAGFTPETGYLGSSQAYGSLKPEERKALEALAAREHMKENPGPSFLLPREYGPMAISLGQDYQVVMAPRGSRAASARIEDGALVYAGAYDSADALFVPGPSQVEMLYLIRKPVSEGLSFSLRGGGAVSGFRLNGGKLAVLSRKTGAAVLELSPPQIFDSKGRSVPGRYELAARGRDYELRLEFAAAGLSYPLLVDPAWTTAGGGTLTSVRYQATATLLPNGKVLVAGGNISGTAQSSAELYDPIAGTWSATGSMSAPRYSHTATLLPNGNVLVAGGYASAAPLNTAELYNPASGSWSEAAPLNMSRSFHTATLLNNGKVLAAGGTDQAGDYYSTAEIFDPVANTWTPTGSLTTTRSDHTATLLPNGQVLVAGGASTGGNYLSSAEIYDPVAATWSATGSMTTTRSDHSATLLPTGQVLVAGGYYGAYLSSAEIYNPTAGTWSATNSMAAARSTHIATLLPNGQVLVAGGSSTSGALSAAEIYDSASATWSAASNAMSTPRFGDTGTLLPNGKILIAGGSNGSAGLSSAEIYDPAAGAWSSAAGSLNTARFWHTATLLPNGEVLLAGGNYSNNTLSTAELYNPATGTSSPTGSMSTARQDATSALLPNGKVLIFGGTVAGGGSIFSTAELYDPTAATFSLTGSMATARANATATLLPNGKVLVTGGQNSGSAALSTAELYDPASGTWSPTGSMLTARNGHTATLLPSGQVLIAAGQDASGNYPLTTELYNPASGSFTATGSLITGRVGTTAVLLPNGSVLIAAGGSAGGNLSEAELYNPSGGTWSATGSLLQVRSQPFGALLPNGKVVIGGGCSAGCGSVLSEVETYDPASGAFSAAPSLLTPLYEVPLILLPAGKLLLPGGNDCASGSGCATAQLQLLPYTEYDVFTATAIRPVIGTINGLSVSSPVTMNPGTVYTIAGASFTGLGEGSGGDYGPMNSPANLPRAYLMPNASSTGSNGIGSGGSLIGISTSIYGSQEETYFNSGQASTQTQVTIPSALSCGYYNLFMQSGGVPSTGTIVRIAPPPPTSTPGAFGSSMPSYHSIGLSFGADGSDPVVSGYAARACADSACSVVVSTAFTTTSAALSLVVPGLSSNTLYYFEAAAENCAGLGPFTSPLSATTLAPPPPGCASAVNVRQDGTADTTTIHGAVSLLPTSLTGNECVVIRDTQTYNEQVNVQGFANNGFQVEIMADPSFVSSAPVVNPSSGTAAFMIANASVTVAGINVAPSHALSYGVLISSAYVSISSMNIQDAGGEIATAGISASSWTTVKGSSVTVGAANASALWLTGAFASVLNSVVTASASSGYALYLNGVSSNTISQSILVNASGTGASLNNNANYNTISNCSVTGTGSGYMGVVLNGSSYNTIALSSIGNPAGTGANVNADSNWNTISQSSMTSGQPGGAAFVITGAFNNTIAQSYIADMAGYGAYLASNSGSNLISQSTVTSASAYPALYLTGVSANLFSGDFISGSTAAYIAASTGTVITGSVLAATAATGSALQLDQASNGLTLSNSSLSARPTGFGLSLSAGNTGVISLTTDTIMGAGYGVLIATQAGGSNISLISMNFAGLAPGATAMQFTGGTLVSTFTGVSFDSSVAVNVNAAALSTGSSITMAAPSGTKSGAAYDTDPNHYVHWPSSTPPTSAITGPPAGYVNSLPSISGTAQAYNGATVSSVTVTVQNLGSGAYWNGASFSSSSQVFNLASLSTSSLVWSYINAALSTSLTNGTSYQIQSQATDSLSQVQSVPSMTGFIFDNQPPVTAIVNPISGTILNSVPAISGTGFDNVLLSTVQLSVQDVTTGGCYRPSNNTFAAACPAWFPAQGPPTAWSFAFPAQPWTQTHQYVILSSGTDAAQNAQVAPSSAGFLFDVVAPTVTVTVPNLFMNPTETEFVGLSTETTAGLSSLQFALTSSTGPGNWLTSMGGTFTSSAPVFFATTTYAVGSAQDAWTWVYATALTDGQNYVLRTQAADKAANVRTQNVSFLYDATPAVATITFPTNGSALSSTPTITGGSYDTPGPGGFASGVSTVAVSIMNRANGHCYVAGGGFVSACPNFNPAAGSPAAWTFTPSPNPFTTGASYLVVAQGVDNSGNVQGVYVVGASSNTFTYDTAIPQVGVTSPIPQAGDRETPATLAVLAGTAYDTSVSLALVQLRVQKLPGPIYWNPVDGLFEPIASETAWFNASSTNQYVNWSSTTNNISYAGMDGSTFTVIARSLNSAGTYSNVYSSNAFVYDSLAPQTGVTSPANGAYVNALALAGTAADLPANNPGSVASLQLRLERLSDGSYWNGTSAWVPTATMGAAQGVSVFSSSWSVAGVNLPSGASLLSGASYYVTTSGTDNADGGGNTEAFGNPRGSMFTYDNTPPAISIQLPISGAVYASLPTVSGTSGDNVAVASVTLSVQQLGGLCYSPVSAAFNAVCPSAFAAQGPASAWSYSALPWINGQQYVFVATARDLAGNVSNSSTTFTFAVSTSLVNGTPGDGQGTATLSPPSAAGCQVFTATATFTAGPAGIALGGAIALHVPAGWTQPQGVSLGQPGYVSVVSTGGYIVQFNPPSLGNTTLGTNWIVYVATTSMTPGQAVQFAYQGYPAQGSSAQGPQIFAFDSRGAGNGNLVGLSSSPALSVLPGAAALLSFSPSSPLTLGQFQNSPPMQLQLWDTCGVPTVQTGSALPIALQAVAGGATDSRAVFYSTAGAVVSSVSVSVGSGLSSSFYYNTSTSGVALENLVATASLAVSTVSVVRPVDLLVSGASITAVSVDVGTPGSATTATIVENSANGAGLSAFINFTPSNPAMTWEVIVSSDPVNFSPKLADYYGTGNPGRTLTWNGLNNQTSPPQFLPPGTYYVEIVAGGGSAVNTALTVVISPAPSIYGQLTNGPGAKVAAVGPNVLSGNFAIASSTGFFQIFGLQNGTAYTVETTSSVLISSSIVTVNAGVSGVVATPAGTNAGTLTFLLPSLLEVSAALPFPAPADISGTVSVHDASYAHTGSGTIHFFPGATSSDNGAQAFGANASTWTSISLSTDTYEVDIALPALGISTSVYGVVVNNGVPTLLPVTLQKLVNVYGYAVFPAPVAAAAFVSVTAQSQAGASAVGGITVPIAASSAVYSLFGLSPGSWTVTAVSQGALPASTTFFVTGTADIGTAAAGGLNLTLKAAGVLTGTLTVAGNTSQVNMSATCPNGAALCVPVTGLDPANFFNGTVTVVLATSTTQTSSTFSFVGLPDGLYSVSAALNGYTGTGQNASVVSGVGATSLALTANGSKCLVTVNLPAGIHPASDFKAVSLGCAGSLGTALAFPDMTAGTTIQYFASSATIQLSGLNADTYQFQAFSSATGMNRAVTASLASNSSASVLLDLSGPTYSVGGSFSMGSNLTLPNNAGLSVSVSSVPGLLANTGSLSYCLLGYGTPPSISAAHLELLPASSAGAFLSGPLQTAGGGCPANLIDPVGPAGPVVPNPYLAYIATIAVNGNFAFPGVPPGVYLLRNNSQLDAAGDQIPQFSQTVVVTGTVAGLVFQAGSGSTLSGSVQAQAGIALSRSMTVNLMNSSGQLTASAPVVFNNSNSASYSFPQIVNGNYTLVLQDSAYPKAYAAAPLPVQLSGQNLSGQTLSVVPSGTIKCRVVIQEPSSTGGLQSMLVSQPNFGLLPASFQIQASADPWFSGGLASALGPNGSLTPVLDVNGEFVIDGLLPGTYDVKFAAPGGGAGTVSLVNSAVPGIAVTAGNVTDIGIVNLGGGTQLTGIISDASTALPLANIHVHALPSARGSGVASQAVDAVTDGSGRYVLGGLDPTVRFYDIYAAYRGVEVQGESLAPYQLTISPSVDLSAVSVLNFKLAPAVYSVTGHVVVPAGGPALGVPTAVGQPAQGALIYFQKSGVIPVSNPIADIQFQTDYNGNFTIPSLTTGTYLMIATSLGYASLNQLVTISTASVNVGVLTMAQGATLTGSLTNPDGSNPSQSQVSQVLAVTSDLANILVGSLTTNPNTQTATAYTIAGFKPGLSYRVILLDSQNDMVSPPEAAGVIFPSTGTATINIVYRAVAPLVIALADRQGTGFQLEFDMSQPLRALTPSDSNLPAILTPVSAAGSLSAFALSQDRTRLTAFYQPGVSESSFTLHLRGYCTLVNPASVDPVNPQFLSESTVTFYTGIDGLGQTNVANLQGGDVIVQGDNGRVTLAPGSFNVAVSSAVLITLQVAGEPLTTGIATSGLSGAAARLQSLRYSPQAYPSEIVAAAAAVPPSVNPLSAFYNIFLPLGVSTALSKPAQLTVAYSTGTDPTTLNLYWYNPAANAYVLTQDVTGAQPVINTANHTITLNVNHFSTYVLFKSAQAVITGGTGAGALTVDNFPNPFDLGSKTVTPLHAGTGSCSPSCVINGTMIGVSVPPSLSGDATIRIFNVAGTRVRTIDLGSVQGGDFYYQNWDGTNDSGAAVASGVYIGELKIGGQSVFFKMAIIKGSGL